MLRDFLTCCSLAQSQQAARCPPLSVAACLLRAARRSSRTAMTTYPQKIAFGEMREMAARDVLIYCRDYLCLITSRSMLLGRSRPTVGHRAEVLLSGVWPARRRDQTEVWPGQDGRWGCSSAKVLRARREAKTLTALRTHPRTLQRSHHSTSRSCCTASPSRFRLEPNLQRPAVTADGTFRAVWRSVSSRRHGLSA
jgi:hypothetical protein